MSADVISLLFVNTAIAVVLGASSLLAIRILPIPMSKRWLYLLVAALVWSGAIFGVTLVTDPPLELQLRRLVNGTALIYVASLLLTWAWRTRRTGPARRGNDHPIKA